MTASAVPKIELHVHVEGTVRPPTLVAIAQRNGLSLPADMVSPVHDTSSFLAAWSLVTSCLSTVDDFRQILVAYAADAARAGVVYIEATFSPCEHVRRGVSWDTVFAGCAEGVAEAWERHGVVVRLTPDLQRGVEPDLAERCARIAVRYRDRGVVGLGGRVGAPTEHYRRAWDIARAGGLGLVPHAGAIAGPDAIGSMLAMRPARIGHALRAAEDDRVLAQLAERGVVVDICLSTNLRLGEVTRADAHPLTRFRAAGVICTINTDDPAILDTDLDRELAIAARLGVTAADAYAAGWAGMLCDDATRARLPAPGSQAAVDSADGVSRSS